MGWGVAGGGGWKGVGMVGGERKREILTMTGEGMM